MAMMGAAAALGCDASKKALASDDPPSPTNEPAPASDPAHAQMQAGVTAPQKADRPLGASRISCSSWAMDIGWMQPSIYHRGLMVGETPNIDRIGARARSSWTMSRCRAAPLAQRLLHGHVSDSYGHGPAAASGQPSWLRPGTPALAKFLLDLGYTTGEFGKNHLGDHTEALPTAHGFQEYWGYLYHLDAMQQVSFPDINKSPSEQKIAPPCKNTLIPGLADVAGAVDRRPRPA